MRSSALLLRRVAVAESDAIVTLFTERAGLLSAAARGAARSQRRFAGLEPMHLLQVEVDLAAHRDLGSLAEARVARPRLHLIGNLKRLEAAGQALRWLRRAAPPRTPEPSLWIETNGLLDALDGVDRGLVPQALLGAGGLRMLEATGWGLDLRRCVRCDRSCPEGARATVDVAAGGVVCQRCGGGAIALSAERRHKLLRALAGDETALFRDEDAALAVDLVSRAFETHSQSAGR